MATFNELVNQIDENIEQQRDRGTAFEKLAVAYLENEPAFKNKYSDVWMLNEVPEEYHISKQDTGVDIVARDRATGKLTAVQAKYYRSKINKKNIDSFLAEVGKDYYSDGIIVTSTNDWNKNAKNATEYLTKEISVVGLSQLQNANFDWQLFDFNSRNNLTMKPKKLRDYQKEAIKKSLDYFKTNSRGKLVMAPGTGKTFTSLKIAEALFNEKGGNNYNVLYLVPSIQLLSQTLFNWNSDKSNEIEMVSFSVVSDKKATKKKQGEDDLSARDVGFPATTNVNELMANYSSIRETSSKTMTVVFSTYQSINVIHDAQEAGYPEFDLIIADEAHRTTGAAKLGEDSMFTKVHSDKNVAGNLRLYQTATPKVYGPDAKKKAESNSIELSSMDDEEKYGKEIFRLGFGDAVSRGYLTDYKVSVLAVNENYVNKNMQKIMSSDENELKTSDIGKIIGIWNAMTKRNGMNGAITGAPMKRAIAFTDTIKHSEQVAKEFNNVVNDYLGKQAEDSFSVDVHHVDGGLNALEKKSQLDWLAGSIPENQARVLSNVRFLTEGIDVPNLDAIIFMSPKKSQVDIVQAVGRIMRRYEGKEYGYIILPIVIDANEDPAAALDNNKNYQEVWQVLNALRSIDERFEAEINKLELNKKKSGKINVIGVNTKPNHPITESGQGDGNGNGTGNDPKDFQLALDLGMDMKAIEQAFYGKVVQKVGDRRYLEDWSKDVAEIAKRHINKIKDLVDSQSGAKMAFDTFIKGLRYNINDSIDEEQAIEMLAQHLITQPVFQALFGEYSFVNNNPVSKAMNDVISAFSLFGFDKEQKELEPFYESVKLRASGIDNAEAKQKIIVTLYDNFFRKGFKKTTEQMGIVFTPVEVVDFIVKSVDWALKKYLGRSLADENVHILDPFTGTGTFITRTLQYLKQQMDEGKITYADILRKYMHELHANEIVLLSYYIAAINIETVFDEINGQDEGYVPFNGIVLTDTFESTEEQPVLDDKLFGENNARLKEQQKEPITVIIGNPPYSAGQKNQNDNNANLHYKNLEKNIAQTYVANSMSGLSMSIYDSYVKAFRWATDRLGDKGIIGFVTNGGYLDSNSADGLRASFYKEFNYLYIFNLRGNARTQGEQRRKEKDNVFGQGTRTPIAISILVKDGSDAHELYYHDIGDYLSRKEKIQILENTGSVDELDWQRIIPDENHDWINQRDPNYQKYTPLVANEKTVFFNNAMGVKTNRDIWVIGFSKKEVLKNSTLMIDSYNQAVKNGKILRDDSKIKWSAGLEKKFAQNQLISIDSEDLCMEMYRPFTKKWILYNREVVERPGQYYVKWGRHNLIVITTGRGSSKGFSVLVSDMIPDIQVLMNCQGFMRYNNEEKDESNLLEINHDNVNQAFADKLGLSLDDTFAYIYGLLNSQEYQQKYANDLKKDLARIPVVAEKEKYVEVGKKLMDLHINYEEVPVYEGVTIDASENPSYKVEKMKFDKKRNPETQKLENDRSIIIFNSDITIKNIPEKAYEYVVNGRSAIEWIIDQYQVKTDKKSGITDDPNDFSSDPKYIFNLLLRIINVSVQTVDLVNSLPKLEIIE
ncbi:DEAD/DEAH box helicase [Ligilactobacillus ruminis]|uniref:type ISP restriction/modification enzyme n=1 Tax=Ligilactobacillus ruminis TaxID=1623 RepID=UPI001F21EF9F|nr:type ISP restriction/modification enzyme [Ligilactobacillus ruminis]MCF2544733.1 DEAD/DEAH box helicase [Ligilactobacillus ruminis]